MAGHGVRSVLQGILLFVFSSARLVGHIALMGESRSIYRDLVGKPKGKRPLGRPRHRWEDNIKIDLQEVGWGVWTGSSWLRIGTGCWHL